MAKRKQPEEITQTMEEHIPEFRNVPLYEIVEDPNQPRKTFIEDDLSELADSIKQQGVLQPILLRPHNNGYMIVCGERRYRASQLAGLNTIPATIRTMTDQEALEIQITENLQRKDVDPLEEAESFLVMIEKMGYTIPDVAVRIGKDEKFVSRRLKLNGLIPELKQWMRQHILPLGHGERLAILDQSIQSEWYNPRKAYPDPVPTLAHLKQWISSNVEKKLSNAIFDLHDSHLIANAPACIKCNHNSSVYSLFSEEESICSNRSCFNEKTSAQSTINLNRALEDSEILLVNGEWGDGDVVKKIKKDGHSVISRNDFTIINKPNPPRKHEVDRDDYEDEEDYQEALTEAEEDYKHEMEDYQEDSAKYVDDLKNSLKAYDVVSGKNLHIKMYKSASTDKKNGGVDAKIYDLKQKKRRGLELDQEKIMKKVVEHMIANIPEGLLSKEEMDIIYLDYIDRIGYGKKFDDVKKMFGFTKMYIPSDEMLESLLKSDPKDLGQFVRISLLDTYKSSFQHSTKSKTILTYLAKSWCPDVLKQAELEQEEVKIKREARIDVQIKELEKEVK